MFQYLGGRVGLTKSGSSFILANTTDSYVEGGFNLQTSLLKFMALLSVAAPEEIERIEAGIKDLQESTRVDGKECRPRSEAAWASHR